MDFLTRHFNRMGRTHKSGDPVTQTGRRWASVFGQTVFPKLERPERALPPEYSQQHYLHIGDRMIGPFPTNMEARSFLRNNADRLPENATPVGPEQATQFAHLPTVLPGAWQRTAEIKNEEGDFERTSPENVKNPTETEDPGRGHDLGWDMDPAGTEDEFNRDRRHKKYYGRYPVRGQTVTLAKDVWIRSNDLYAVRNGNEDDGFIRIKRGQTGIVSQVLPGFDRRTKAVQVKFGPNLEAVFAVGRGHADPRKFLRRSRSDKMIRQSAVIYQIVVSGPKARMEGLGQIRSKKMFLTRSEAEAYVPEMITKATTPVDEYDLKVLAKVDSVSLVEHEVDLGDENNGVTVQAVEDKYITPEHQQTVDELRKQFDDEVADSVIGWADSLISYGWLMEGEAEQREYVNMLHQAVGDIANQLQRGGAYEDIDDARVEATAILRKFHVEAQKVRRAQRISAPLYKIQEAVHAALKDMPYDEESESSVERGVKVYVSKDGKQLRASVGDWYGRYDEIEQRLKSALPDVAIEVIDEGGRLPDSVAVFPRRTKNTTAQAEQYFQQQDVEIQIPPMQAGQFTSSAVPGKVVQVETPGKYRIQIPAEGTASGMPTEMLAVDDTYTQPDALNYAKIQGPLAAPGVDMGQPGTVA